MSNMTDFQIEQLADLVIDVARRQQELSPERLQACERAQQVSKALTGDYWPSFVHQRMSVVRASAPIVWEGMTNKWITIVKQNGPREFESWMMHCVTGRVEKCRGFATTRPRAVATIQQLANRHYGA